MRPARQKPFREVRREIRAELDAQAEGDHYNAWSVAWQRESIEHVTCLPEHPWRPYAG